LPTKKIEYDKETRKFHLICDNPACTATRMVTKEGDEAGIEPIRARLDKDEMLMGQVYKMHGIQKVFLRNSIPVERVKEFTDDYEITPEYYYDWNENDKKVDVAEKPWEVKDDEGNTCNSLMPPPVVVSLIKQLVAVLGI
jgi:hypothetical protein